MADFIQWLDTNKEWLFSGVGVLFISWVGYLIFQRVTHGSSQNIRTGDNSTNFQIGRDINIRDKSRHNDAK